MKLSLGLMGLCISLSLFAAPVKNLPNSFYNRKGLEKMPRLNLEKMTQVNVLDCGADNTGKKPCGPAFDKALEKLKVKGGGIVCIPAGIYRFKNPVSDFKNVPARYAWRKEKLNNIHFVGAGREKTIIITDYNAFKYSGNPAPCLWSFNECKNISFRDLSFSIFPYFSMRSPKAQEGVFMLSFGANDGVQVINTLFDQGRISICFWGLNKNSRVVDCDVRNTGADAIKFDSCVDTLAAYNYIECANDDGFSGLEMKAGTARNNVFINNTMVYNKGWGRGIAISGKDQKVIGNWIESQAGTGVLLHEIVFGKFKKHNTPGDNWVIKDNTLIRTDLHNISSNKLLGHRRYGAISGMIRLTNLSIINNKIFGAASNGIALTKYARMNDVNISGNLIEGNLKSGLELLLKDKGYIKGINISGNTIADNRQGSIRMRGKIENITCKNNVIDNPAEVLTTPNLKFLFSKVDKDSKGIIIGTPKGCKLESVKAEYVDIYKAARLATAPTSRGEYPVINIRGKEINVRKYGAKGDGKASDTVAFMSAIAALPPSGGILKIPAGTYQLAPVPGKDALPFTCIKHTLLIKDKKNVHIVGEGAKSILRFTSLKHEGLRLIGLQNSSVSNISMMVAAKSYHRKNRSPLDVVACKDMILKNVVSENSAGYGLRLDACTSVLLDGCKVTNSNQIGINILAGQRIFARNCVVNNSRDHGIYIGSIGGIARMPLFIEIDGCKISGTREGHGIAIPYGDKISIRNNKVSNTYQAGIGIYYSNAIFPIENVLITGNTLTNCAFGKLSYMRGAISCFYTTENRRRRRGSFKVIIKKNKIISTPVNGIWIRDCGGKEVAEIKGNFFKDVKGKDIEIIDLRSGSVHLVEDN